MWRKFQLVAGSDQDYFDRSPINFVDKFSCPIILFQGLEDKVSRSSYLFVCFILSVFSVKPGKNPRFRVQFKRNNEFWSWFVIFGLTTESTIYCLGCNPRSSSYNLPCSEGKGLASCPGGVWRWTTWFPQGIFYSIFCLMYLQT